MDSKPIITSVEVIQYETDAGEMESLHPALELHDIIGVFSPYIYKSGDGFKHRAHGIRIHTSAGVSGEYISIGFAGTDFAAVERFAPSLIGRNALHRDDIYNDFKQAMRQQARMGMGVVDVRCGTWREILQRAGVRASGRIAEETALLCHDAVRGDGTGPEQRRGLRGPGRALPRDGVPGIQDPPVGEGAREGPDRDRRGCREAWSGARWT